MRAAPAIGAVLTAVSATRRPIGGRAVLLDHGDLIDGLDQRAESRLASILGRPQHPRQRSLESPLTRERVLEARQMPADHPDRVEVQVDRSSACHSVEGYAYGREHSHAVKTHHGWVAVVDELHNSG